MPSFEDFIRKRRARYGEKFSARFLDPRWIEFYESEERIEIQTSYGEITRGTIGVVGDFKPVFVLYPREDSKEALPLTERDRLIGVVDNKRTRAKRKGNKS